MSVTDGGSFKCYNHDTLYETLDPQEWEEHMKEEGHTYEGVAPCVICGKTTEFKDLPTNKKVVCENCKEDLK